MYKHVVSVDSTSRNHLLITPHSHLPHMNTSKPDEEPCPRPEKGGM